MNLDLRRQLSSVARNRLREAPPAVEPSLRAGQRHYLGRVWALHLVAVLVTVLLGAALILNHPVLQPPVSGGRVLTAVRLGPVPPVLASGDTHAFTATAVYSDGTSTALDSGVEWDSSDAGVAEVDGTGVVTATGPGQAVVTATYQEAQGSATVTVTPDQRVLTSVRLSPVPPVLELGGTHSFTATAFYSDGTSTPLGPGVEWDTSDAAVAEVDGAGVVTATGPGQATITATYQGVRGSATVTVNPAARVLTAVRLSPVPPVLELGGTHSFTATAFYSDGTSTALNSGVEWDTSDAAVAEVDGAGVVTAAGPGQATITATYQGVQGRATVSVNPGAPVLSEVRLSPVPPVLELGGTHAFTATAVYSDGTSPPLGPGVAWDTSDATIAEVAVVDDAGVVTARGSGETVITATYQGVQGRSTVTVNTPVE